MLYMYTNLNISGGRMEAKPNSIKIEIKVSHGALGADFNIDTSNHFDLASLGSGAYLCATDNPRVSTIAASSGYACSNRNLDIFFIITRPGQKGCAV